MTIIELNDKNFELYAMRHYDNPSCYSEDEFYQDLLHFKYLKKLLNKYVKSGEFKHTLMFNHIIVIYNVFENHAATRMLFYRLKDYHPQLKAILQYMNRLPEIIYKSPEEIIITSDIEIDRFIEETLKTI